MRTFSEYSRLFDEADNRVTDTIEREKTKLTQTVLSELLVPFCRDHRLEFSPLVWHDLFYREDGTEFDLRDIQDQPEAEDDDRAGLIFQVLSLHFMGDIVFDYGNGVVTRDDW